MRLIHSSVATLTLSFAAFLVGCQTVPTAPMPDKHIITNKTAKAYLKKAKPAHKKMLKNKQKHIFNQLQANQLANYKWRLVNAVDKNNQPIEDLLAIKNDVFLSFGKQQNEDVLGFGVGCNSMGSSYQLNNSHLKVNNIMSTQMFCADLTQAENLLSRAMDGTSKLTLIKNKSPILQQVTQNNMTLTWQGKLTDSAKYGKSETLYWEVSHDKMRCTPTSNRMCLKVRPITYNNNGIKVNTGQWQVFSGRIKGFKHDLKSDQILRINRYQSNKSKVTQSAIKGNQYIYVLDAVIESKQAN